VNPLQNAPEEAFSLVALLIRLGLLFLGTIIVIRIGGLLIKRIERAIREDASGHDLAREKRAKTVGDVLRRTLRGMVVAVAFLMAMHELGLDITPMLATAGGFGVAAGLGAQSLVRDWIQGFFIIKGNQLAVGDVVRVAGVTGTVEGVSLRQSEIRDGDGSLHFVPNGEIKIVTNLSKAWSTPTVRIPVSLTEDPARALAEMRAMVPRFSEIPDVKAHLLEPVRVLGIDDVSAGQFTILLQARTTPEQRYGVSRALRLAAIEQLRGAGIGLHTVTSLDAADQETAGAGVGTGPTSGGTA
jgi:moderate conductance mechanosensitive channel